MKSKLLKMICATLLYVGAAFVSAFTQPYPDTIYIPVTFFDFHSTFDAQGGLVGCPEFNPCPGMQSVGRKTGMVQSTLDTDGLPVGGSTVYFSKYIANWYRSSVNGEQPVTDVFPRYDYRNGTWIVDDNPTFNPWENVKIVDSLTFVHIGNGITVPLGTYEFRDTSFFPLDNRGFGNEPTWNFDRQQKLTDHNYAFTMMMETEFTYQSNMKFHFSGDDDVWVFIKNQQVLDIGGIHEEIADSLNLDDIAGGLGLVIGQKYTLSFFFAERQADLCHIAITSNMITYSPNKLLIKAVPDDTIFVGDTLIATATILTDTGEVNICELPGTLSWGFRDLFANNPASTFTSSNDTAVFIPVEAWTTVEIFARYDDNVNSVQLKDTVDVVVLPGKPDRIVIEASPTKPGQGSTALWNNNPLDEVTIGQNADYTEQFYAILRDREQNWIGPADPIDTWKSSDVTLITTQKGFNPAQGQGRADRATWSKAGSAFAIALRDTLGKSLIDSIKVTLEGQKFNVLSATYYETDIHPDGFIDQINIVVDDKLTITDRILDAIFPNLSLPPERKFNFSRSDLSSTGKGFSIAVSQSVDITPNTSVDPQVDRLTISETQITGIGALAAADLLIGDSLAPVVLQGIFYPKSAINDASFKDTLMVDFSEVVPAPSVNEPFEFFDVSGMYPNNYTMTLMPISNSSGKQIRFIVEKTGKTYPQNGDSLWIIGSKNVRDMISNIQTRDTKYAPLIVKPYPLFTSITILNPVSLGNLALPQTLINWFKLKSKSEGTLVIVDLSGHIENPEDLTAILDILDVTGNTVRKNIKSKYVEYQDSYNEQHNALVIAWDIRNRNGRLVGPATYCGLLVLKNKDVVIEQKRILIGVKY